MSSSKLYQIDEAFIRRVAAMVVERLRAMASRQTSAAQTRTLPHKIISEKHILETSPGTKLVVRRDALITPLAKDTARDRNITLVRSSE